MPLRWAALASALLMSLSLTACGGSAHHPAGTLRLPVYDQLSAPDPTLAATDAELSVDSLLYSGLMKFGPDLHVIPELAVSIPTISASGRTYTFTIRQDARFADGAPCTAKDVAFSLVRALHLGGPLARQYLGRIQGAADVMAGRTQHPSGIRAVHRLTLRIRLTEPDADFLEKLSFPIAAVVDRRVVPDGPIRSWSVVAGTGAWIVSRLGRDGSLTMVPRPYYYGGVSHLRALILVPVRNEEAGLTLYRKNALDAALVPFGSMSKLATSSDFHQTSALDAYYAIPRSPGARRLASLLDRDRLIQDVGPGLSALSAIVPPGVPDYVSSPPSLSTNGDPSAGIRLVQINVPSAHDAVSLALKKALIHQWSSRPAQTGGTATSTATASFTLLHASYRLPDPGVWLRIMLPYTRSHWFRSSLAHAALLTNDPVTRMDMYDRCERWAIEKGLVLPLASSWEAYLIKPSVQSLQVTPAGIMPDNNSWPTVDVT